MSSAKTTESNLWSWLKKGGKELRYRLHMNRIENAVSSGMPDVEGCLDGSQFWIELKCEPRPVRPTTKIKPRFQPKQVPWIKRRARAGGIAYVLLQVGSSCGARRYLIADEHLDTLEKIGFTEAALARISLSHPQALAAIVINTASF